MKHFFRNHRVLGLIFLVDSVVIMTYLISAGFSIFAVVYLAARFALIFLEEETEVTP
jgi:hypothetical protein